MAEKKEVSVLASFPTQTIPLGMIEVKHAFNSRVNSGVDKQSIEELAQSIESNGLLQPILVRAQSKGFFAVAGFRRIAAHQLLKRSTIEAKVLPEGMSDVECMLLNYAENAHRKDLSNYEKARRLSELEAKGVKLAELGKRLDFDMAASTVGNMIRIHNYLAPKIKADWANPESKTRAFLTIPHLLKYIGGQGKEDHKLQMERYEEACGLVRDTDAAASGEEAAEPGKRKGNRTLVKRDKVLEAIKALSAASLPETAVADCMAAFNFVLRKSGGKKNPKLIVRGITVYPVAVAETEEEEGSEE